MKKIGLLLSSLAFFSSCDDGDIVYEALDFKNSSVVKCATNELYFKINKHELLLVDLNNTNNALLNPDLELGREYTISTSSNNQIIYRSYNGNVSSNTICSTIPPAQPQVQKEYISQDGCIISYVKNMTINTITNAEGASTNEFDISYNYTINFKNLTLSDGITQLKYENYNFGTVQSNISTTRVSFNFNQISACNDGNNMFYSSGNSKLLNIKLASSLPETTGIQALDLNENQYILYRSKPEVLSINVDTCNDQHNDEHFTEIWKATSGTLEIEHQFSTELNANIYIFRLVDATFTKSNKEFKVSNLELGTLQQ